MRHRLEPMAVVDRKCLREGQRLVGCIADYARAQLRWCEQGDRHHAGLFPTQPTCDMQPATTTRCCCIALHGSSQSSLRSTHSCAKIVFETCESQSDMQAQWSLENCAADLIGCIKDCGVAKVCDQSRYRLVCLALHGPQQP